MAPTTPLKAVKPHYPVLIIGAGINGCGLFRDLNLQGIDCLLIDRGDICEGASAAPSRLIHGGIKYLETGEFRLVRESAMERNRLLRNAPHFVKPLATVLPMRSWLGGIVPSALRFLGFNAKLTDRGALITEIGLQIYDFYNRKVRALPDHRFLSSRKLRVDHPAFAPDIKAAGLYYEGRITHAERLGLELVMDGVAANGGSTLSTYTTASIGKTPREIVLADRISGESVTVTTDAVVNAGGAWIDKVNAGLGIVSQHMGGSKGSHLIVNSPVLLAALQGRMVYFGTADGRVNLVYPFFGNVLIGSTDIPVKDPDEAFCSVEETKYLLKVVSEIFPAITIDQSQILLSYCGVRPLPRSEGKDIGAVSRDHLIGRDMLPGSDVPVLSLIGGKWTTFRAFAEQSADVILSLLSKTRIASTEALPIGGGRNYPLDEGAVAAFTGAVASTAEIDAGRARHLFDSYGTTALAVAETVAVSADRPLAFVPGYSSGEIIHICRTESVRRLADILLRRTAMAMEGLLNAQVVAEVAEIAAATLGWDDRRTASEINHALAEMKRRAIPEISAVSAAA